MLGPATFSVTTPQQFWRAVSSPQERGQCAGTTDAALLVGYTLVDDCATLLECITQSLRFQQPMHWYIRVPLQAGSLPTSFTAVARGAERSAGASVPEGASIGWTILTSCNLNRPILHPDVQGQEKAFHPAAISWAYKVKKSLPPQGTRSRKSLPPRCGQNRAQTRSKKDFFVVGGPNPPSWGVVKRQAFLADVECSRRQSPGVLQMQMLVCEGYGEWQRHSLGGFRCSDFGLGDGGRWICTRGGRVGNS